MSEKVQPIAPRIGLRERAKVAELEAEQQQKRVVDLAISVHQALGFTTMQPWEVVLGRIDELVRTEAHAKTVAEAELARAQAAEAARLQAEADRRWWKVWA